MRAALVVGGLEGRVMVQVVAVPLTDGSFAALVRECRHRAFLSQEQLAARAELSERTVRNLEGGRVRSPRADTVRLLADALELTEPEREGWFAAARGVVGEPAGAASAGLVVNAGGRGAASQRLRGRAPVAWLRVTAAALRRRGGGPAGRVARDLVLAGPAIPGQVSQLGPDVGGGGNGWLSDAGQCELTALRRENRKLREDLETVMRAAAILAALPR